MYRRTISYILQWFKFHRNKIHLYGVKFDSYTYFLDEFYRYDVTRFFSKFTRNFVKALYYFGLKKLKKRTNSFSYDLIQKENSSQIEIIFISYLTGKNFKIHYHILIIVFLIEIYVNNWVITYTYKILPFVFLYDIWVRLTKTSELRNTTYDIAMHHLIHVPITSMTEYDFTFGDSTYDKVYLKEIMIKYVRNGFRDKDKELLFKKISGTYHIFDDLKQNKYFLFFWTILICHYISNFEPYGIFTLTITQ